MRLTRLLLLSVINNLKEYLHEQGFTTDDTLIDEETEELVDLPYVFITEKQDYDELKTPCIVVYPSNEFDVELQIGGGYWDNTMLMFDIYGRTEGQTHELVDAVKVFLRRGQYLFNYHENPPKYQVSEGIVRTYYEEGSPSAVGRVTFRNRNVMWGNREDGVGEATVHPAQISAVAEVPTR